jgi:hypothetical protein
METSESSYNAESKTEEIEVEATNPPPDASEDVPPVMIKRGRGRPRKSDTNKSDKLENTEAKEGENKDILAPQKRGRGRPRKDGTIGTPKPQNDTSLEKRKSNRKRKAPEMMNIYALGSPHKKALRRRKSFDGKKSETSGHDADDEESDAKKIKRGRGRPRKIQTEAQSEKRRRSPKKPIITLVDDEDGDNAEDNEVDQELNTSPSPSIKRGRGRPRKSPLPNSPSTKSTEESV